ncbi:unnamed protein product [Rotaria sordida]|uniref:Uncharacterized protein n=1 Tax=Rotaria sordida TaxID=392033 RepID=A0A818QSN0_9BILA|nr:unnamed protein product [Rotaria sordida]CAF1483159.1 unnamed protein product [Rotaria sordida]CAF3646010.1 unnamed protein product [Rotaria sordida]CAF4048021.1 unnamed protein product [Rotaria sordida]
MKSFTIFFVLLSTYCYCKILLGGWSTSDDESLKQEWLKQALVKIRRNEILDQVQSNVSDLVCKTQIVNGLNIECNFVLNGEKWQCLYYKSFTETFDTQLEKCEQPKDQQIQEENNNGLMPGEHDDEQDIEELTISNDIEKPATLHGNKNEEKPSTLNDDDENEEHVVQETLALNEDEEDDEAKIDATYKKLSKNDVINKDEKDDEEEEEEDE